MHSSEAGVDRRHITATVANCGTVRELAMNVDMVIARLHAATM
jgi:hypothetical protein